MKDHHGCPVQGTINVLTGKWKVLLAWHLGFGPRRFAELRNPIAGISERVLTSQLRELESDGVVQRKIKLSNPPQVTYFLTKGGDDLIRLMSDLCYGGHTPPRHSTQSPHDPQSQVSRALPQTLGAIGAFEQQVFGTRDLVTQHHNEGAPVSRHPGFPAHIEIHSDKVN